MPNRRAKLQMVHTTASPEEAAAVMAAVERFLRDTTPVLAAEPEKPSAWVRAALLEGVEREPESHHRWL